METRKRLSLALTILMALAWSSEAHAIQGGAAAKARDQLARATVAVGTVNRPGGGLRLNHCTGVLIGPDLVLTAAHCVRDDPVAAAVLLYDGSAPVQSLRPVAAVATTEVEAGNLPSDDLLGRLQELSLDIAVLRLAAPVPGRKPLPVVRNPRQLPTAMRLAGAGWSGHAAGTLKTAKLRPLLITDTGLTVAKAVDSEVCIGDSGGPVVVEGAGGPAIWGVASAIITSRVPCSDIVVIAPAGIGRLPP